MEIISLLYYHYSLMFTVNLGALFICLKLPRRKRFWIPLVTIVALNIFFAWAWWYFFDNFMNSENVFLQCTIFLIQYIFTFALILFTFDCKVITAVFCATCGYCLQQIISRITNMIPQIFNAIFPIWAILLIYIFTGGIILSLFYLYFKKRGGKNSKSLSVRSPIQLIIMTMALVVMIIIEQAMIPTVFGLEDKLLVFANFASSLIFAVIILLLEFNLLINEEYRTELDVMKQISLIERQQYEMEKTVIDTINIKSHDLKHQLNALNGKVDEAEVSKIKSAVDIYDSTFKTGNNALDVVLTMKSLICRNKNIELTAMLDGKKLSFISDTDIYSFFGNILDNAIEAVDGIADEDKRVISISAFEEKSMLFIRAENYCYVEPKLVDGIPQTTKEDKQYHGFGIKSIGMIAASYGGEISITVQDGIFTLDIMFFKADKQ